MLPFQSPYSSSLFKHLYFQPLFLLDLHMQEGHLNLLNYIAAFERIGIHSLVLRSLHRRINDEKSIDKPIFLWQTIREIHGMHALRNP